MSAHEPTATADAADAHPWWPPDPDTIALPIVCRPSPFLWFAAVLFGVMAPLCLFVGLFPERIDTSEPWPVTERAAFVAIGAGITWAFVALRVFLRTTTLDRGGVTIHRWLGGGDTRLRWDDIQFLELYVTHQSCVLEFGSGPADRHGLSRNFHLGLADALAAFRAFVVPRLAYDIAERIEAGESVIFPQWTPLTLDRTKRRPPKRFVRIHSRGIEARLLGCSRDVAWSDVTGYVVLSETAGTVTTSKGDIPIDLSLSNGLALLAILPALVAAAG